jgi:hypothetical protein
MTAFGIAAMIGGRMSGKLSRSLPQKNLVVSAQTLLPSFNSRCRLPAEEINGTQLYSVCLDSSQASPSYHW